MQSGIYQIRCIINGKRYIGSSRNIDFRWTMHIKQLENSKHHNYRLQKDWSIFGILHFEFTILERCAIDQLIKREQWYFDNCKPEYNIQPIAGSSYKQRRSYFTRLKIKNARFNTKRSIETKLKMSKSQEGKIGHGRKFSDAEIRSIRSSLFTDRQLAKEYGVSHVTIYHIRMKKLYKDVI